MSKVLLTTPCQPYPTQAWNDSLTDGTSQRFTKGQDIFTMSGHQHCMGSHLIAQNISVPSVFLEYPTWEGFEEEIKKGYDYIGFSFFPTCMDIVLDMCKMVRHLSPSSQIVLGHYGALAFNAAFPEDFKREYADHVCIGEGVEFFRKLLGEPVGAPIRQSHLPKCSFMLPWLDYYAKGTYGFTVAGLGCPSGCDFCSTTQMHGNAWVQLATPQQIFLELKRAFRDDPDLQQVNVYDEDLFKHKEFVDELRELIENDEEVGLQRIDIFTLGSIESLEQYTWDEIALTGLGGIFIGLESKFAPESGYQKRVGDARETFAELQRRGITITGGWMCGFDFHDRVNIFDDLDYFISLEPTSHQLTKVTAFPGTPLWDRLKEEGRLREIPWEDVNFYGGGFKHKNFEDHEIMEILLYGYRKLYETHGPTVIRQFKVELNGYEYFRNHTNKALRERRAERHRDHCEQLYPLIRACEHFAPNGIVRRNIRQEEERYLRNFGEPSSAQKAQSAYILAKAFQEKAKEAISPRNRNPRQEPFKKYTYSGKPPVGDEIPYRVSYPERQKDWGYRLDRAWMNLKTEAMGQAFQVLDGIDQLRGHRITGKSNTRAGTRL
ncbi:MAG: hypothetical protein QF619_10525 [Candidatus Binatia bacterium]|jgi:haloalkane dehalogenase|nr:hypothetical protein [Candidatus Binatia bacterium]